MSNLETLAKVQKEYDSLKEFIRINSFSNPTWDESIYQEFTALAKLVIKLRGTL
jgi:hypothetical protein